MSRHELIRCSCGQFESRDDSFFTSVFWCDTTSALQKLGLTFNLPEPYLGIYLDQGSVHMPVEVMSEWVGKIADVNNKSQVILYEIVEGPEPVYFKYSNKFYMVETVYNRIEVSGPLQDDDFGLLGHKKYFAIPEINGRLAELIFDSTGAVVKNINCEGFNEIFSSIPVRLKSDEFFSFFRNEIAQIKNIIEHCHKTGEQIVYLYY